MPIPAAIVGPPVPAVTTSTESAPSATITIVRGRARIADHLPQLCALGSRYSQLAAAQYLDYFLGQPYTGGKVPHLLLFHEPSEPASSRTPALVAAVLVHQYRRFGLSLGVFVTEDRAGERNVIAPAELRATIALQAAQHLLSHGANLVLIALQGESASSIAATTGHQPISCSIAALERSLARRLPLAPTYEATLSTLGTHTRRNLRAYRRRALQKLACTFQPTASITEADFVALNRLCSYPTPDAVTVWRFRSVHAVPGGFLCGLHDGQGQWLSLLGGRRCSGTTYIDWQLNRRDLAEFSLSTVLRSFVIEHEGERGMHTLLFEGGTPHSIRLAFAPEQVTDLLVTRRTLTTRLLSRLLPRLLPSTHPLAQALNHPALQSGI